MSKDYKEEAINKIGELLNSLEKVNGKKCRNLSIWIKNYVEYLKYEDKFEPKRLCRYRKGQILKVNLGFNIGSEEGGVHYCMVLDKECSKNSPVVTVIPLTSVKENKDLSKLKKGEVYLGDELFMLLNLKWKLIKDALERDIENTKKYILEIESEEENIKNDLENIESKLNNLNSEEKNQDREGLISILKDVLNETQNKIKTLNKKREETIEKINFMNEDLKLMDKIVKEISIMKKGSIALINQITTISKMRIIDPKSDRNILSGIKFSGDKLDLIDNELKKMYIK